MHVLFGIALGVAGVALVQWLLHAIDDIECGSREWEWDRS